MERRELAEAERGGKSHHGGADHLSRAQHRRARRDIFPARLMCCPGSAARRRISTTSTPASVTSTGTTAVAPPGAEPRS